MAVALEQKTGDMCHGGRYTGDLSWACPGYYTSADPSRVERGTSGTSGTVTLGQRAARGENVGESTVL